MTVEGRTEGRGNAPPRRKADIGQERDCFTALFCSAAPAVGQTADPETQQHLDNKEKVIRVETEASQNVFPPGLATQNVSSAEIQSKASAAGVKFLDPDFPPNDDSLFKVDKLAGVKGFSTSPYSGAKPAVEWRRASEFIVDGVKIFDRGICPNDVEQGQLGDCWLMCSIAAISSVGEREHNTDALVRDVIIESESNAATGLYVVKLCKDGKWQKIQLDDYFPCQPKGGPLYAHASGPEIWAMLLEKAYAKYHGSYVTIRSGFPYEAMMDLTVS